MEQLKKEGYVPQRLYNRDPVLHRCLDGCGPASGTVSGTTTCTSGCCSAPGAAPRTSTFAGGLPGILPAEKRMAETYQDQTAWIMSLQHRPQRRAPPTGLWRSMPTTSHVPRK
ncbi:MAG: hypothetical protein ACLTYN_06220 [Dysosmobacter welbionis]